jgi:hypothetical protein
MFFTLAERPSLPFIRKKGEVMVLYKVIFRSREWKLKDSELNGSKISPNLIYS